MAMNRKEKGEIAELKDSFEELGRHVGVLVEGLRSEIRIVAEQYGSIVRKLEEHDGRFEEIDRRFDKVDLRFDRLDLEFSAMKTGLFDTSHRVDDHETRIRRLEL
ncbi:MAG: hypothetical protein Q8O12_02175 [Candidatus Omnitrophota bacterium]|nr:hypothetical protein [Candidatus Omnitrophota bacterium]